MKALDIIGLLISSKDDIITLLNDQNLKGGLKDALMQSLYNIDSDMRRSALDMFRKVVEKDSESCVDLLNKFGFFDAISKRKDDKDMMVRISWIKACKAILKSRVCRNILRSTGLEEELFKEMVNVKILDREASVQREAIEAAIALVVVDDSQSTLR
ncbi:hypothetical protein BC829DRAFT_301840 [Chytridium lagenaria]|nr:hypothetical protein BC829DRAFT_301840 [Chytridium lagenaria]